MKRIDRYIFKTVVGTTLVALLVLLGMEMFFGLMTELEDLGEGHYTLLAILEFMALTLPRRLYETFPMGLLLGGLLGMGALAQHSELVVMRAAGLSRSRLIWAALQAGLVMGGLALVIGEYIAPASEHAAQLVRAEAKYEARSIRRGRGFWARDGDEIINVRAVLPDNRLVDITLYELNETAELKSLTHAGSARYERSHWILEGVSRSRLDGERVVTERLPELVVNWALNPELLEVLALDPEDLALRDLSVYIRYLHDNGLDARHHELAFWTKALAPLTNLAMLFIALPFAFAPQRASGIGQRLLIGVLLGLAFFLLNRLLGNVVLLYNYPPWLGAILPTLLFFGAGAYALRLMR
ncbi:MAG: LPS export ABC transporter permease LptG [Gammaproteobacteria bacterium]|nr:LPS export ABC transporter permease LptG [Gammaproteobacteria bacterium]MCP5425968.1 LPS export ABC transporter permease LptG [Gammaproteobacteria bacterium]MCP5458844.1 LPS export ABC transporter permease LptG [Gammaproteobacteria bacterium]